MSSTLRLARSNLESLLLPDAVGAAHDGVVALVRLERELLGGLELLLLQLLHLAREHRLGRHRRVDAVRLKGLGN